jgi:hypothetical protein
LGEGERGKEGKREVSLLYKNVINVLFFFFFVGTSTSTWLLEGRGEREGRRREGGGVSSLYKNVINVLVFFLFCRFFSL